MFIKSWKALSVLYIFLVFLSQIYLFRSLKFANSFTDGGNPKFYELSVTQFVIFGIGRLYIIALSYQAEPTFQKV